MSSMDIKNYKAKFPLTIENDDFDIKIASTVEDIQKATAGKLLVEGDIPEMSF